MSVSEMLGSRRNSRLYMASFEILAARHGVERVRNNIIGASVHLREAKRAEAAIAYNDDVSGVLSNMKWRGMASRKP